MEHTLLCSVLFKSSRRDSYACCSPFCSKNSKYAVLLAHGWGFWASFLYIYRLAESLPKRPDELQMELCGWLFLFKTLPRYHHERGSARVRSKTQMPLRMSVVLCSVQSYLKVTPVLWWLAVCTFLSIYRLIDLSQILRKCSNGALLLASLFKNDFLATMGSTMLNPESKKPVKLVMSAVLCSGQTCSNYPTRQAIIGFFSPDSIYTDCSVLIQNLRLAHSWSSDPGFVFKIRPPPLAWIRLCHIFQIGLAETYVCCSLFSAPMDQKRHNQFVWGAIYIYYLYIQTLLCLQISQIDTDTQNGALVLYSLLKSCISSIGWTRISSVLFKILSF